MNSTIRWSVAVTIFIVAFSAVMGIGGYHWGVSVEGINHFGWSGFWIVFQISFYMFMLTGILGGLGIWLINWASK